jgi:hypothetical protein
MGIRGWEIKRWGIRGWEIRRRGIRGREIEVEVAVEVQQLNHFQLTNALLPMALKLPYTVNDSVLSYVR